MKNKKDREKTKSEMNAMFFIILIALVMFIISTYAWFSTQKNVSITNLTGTVEVAEGLEISLDAENWSNGIVLGEEDGQLSIIDNAYSGHHNISPSEMLPVSTLGLVAGGQTDLKMLRGKITNSKELSDIKSMIETETVPSKSTYPGYFAFDVFLKNSSKSEGQDDVLQLNYDSSLEILEAEKTATGLQNTARIAFAKYNGTSDVMADQETILKETAGIGVNASTPNITDVAIWEPNSSDHVEYIVQNNNKITWSESDSTAYATKQLENGAKGFDLTTAILSKDKQKMMSIYKDLMTLNEEPVKLIVLVANSMRLIYQVKLLDRKGYTDKEIGKILGINPYRLKYLRQEGKDFDLNELLKCLDALSKLDVEIKTGKIDKKMGLELFMIRI